MKFKFLKNKNGGTMILLTMLILAGIISVTLGSAEIIRTGLILGRTQVYSTVAFFAAEAGAEKILYDVRYGEYNIEVDPTCTGGNCVFFHVPPTANTCLVCTDSRVIQPLPNGATYKISYTSNPSNPSNPNILKSIGSYNNIMQRAVELIY